jgi:hypothetical protein
MDRRRARRLGVPNARFVHLITRLVAEQLIDTA